MEYTRTETMEEWEDVPGAWGEQEEELQYIVFRIASVYVGVEMDKVRRFSTKKEMEEKMYQEDGAAETEMGNGIIPVLDLHELFQKAPLEIKNDTVFVIFSKDDKTLAFPVDNVEGLCNLSQENLHPLPDVSKGQNKYFEQAVSLDGKIVLILNMERLLQMKRKERG